MKKYKRTSYTGGIVKLGVTNMVGMGLLGATASMANSLPAGTAKDIAGVTTGLQATAMLGPNLKMVKKAFPKKKVF